MEQRDEYMDLVRINEAAKILGVSVDTVRRWDKSGRLTSIRKPGGHRYYKESDLRIFLSDLLNSAKEWTYTSAGNFPAKEFYCAHSAVFQARLTRMQDSLVRLPHTLDIASLIVAIAGEIGNNSYDHNLGNWPDIPGIFFGYDLHKKYIVLADRGLGVLATLKRALPALASDEEALRVAFTKIISGRAPENRGNGLKFVKRVIEENPISLLFQSGEAEAELNGRNARMDIRKSKKPFRGCLAWITF